MRKLCAVEDVVGATYSPNMNRGGKRSEQIFDIWEHFEDRVTFRAEQLHPGHSAQFGSEDLSRPALSLEIARKPEAQGYSVAIVGVDTKSVEPTRLHSLGWRPVESVQARSDAVPQVEQDFSCTSELASNLSTALREALKMSDPWFDGLASVEHLVLGNLDYRGMGSSDAHFDAHQPLAQSDVLGSVTTALSEGYGPYLPMMVDGVYLVHSRTHDLLIRPEQSAGVIWLTWSVDCQEQGKRALAGRVKLLNESGALAHFAVEDAEVVGHYTLLADPLIPVHLYRLINRVGEAIREAVADRTLAYTSVSHQKR